MRIGVITSIEPLGQGLHRVLARGLTTALISMGHSVERVLLPFTGRRDVLEQIWAFRAMHVGETFDRIVTLRPPAHLIVHPHKVVWLSEHPGYGDGPGFAAIERRVAAADRTALLDAERVFTTSAAARTHWHERTGVQGALLHPPCPEALGTGPLGDLDMITAVHLGPDARGACLPQLADALRLTSPAVRVRLCGGLSDPVLREDLALRRARLQPGRLLIDNGRPDADTFKRMLAQAQALICLSADDDLAMAVMDRAAAEARPTIVSCACGAALQRVSDTQTGIAVDVDDAKAVAGALDAFAASPAWAASLGHAARNAMSTRPSWDVVAQAVLDA